MTCISKLVLSIVIAGGLAAAISTSAGAEALPAPGAATEPGLFLLHFNENGQGTITFGFTGGPTAPLTGTLMIDPAAPPGSPPALTFLLPEPIITGDVGIAETPLFNSGSDWLRFTDAAGTISGAGAGAGPRMIFYSDVPEAGEAADLADTGPPANVSPFLGTIEIGAEGSNSFDWKPFGIGFPGNNEYIGISDAAVPEPSSLTLLGSSVAGLALMLWRYCSKPRSWAKESTEHLSLARK